MKKIIFIVVIVIAITTSAAMQQTDKIVPKLTIKITNIETIKGNLMIGVFDNEKDFTTDNYFKSKVVKVTDKTMLISFTDIPKGIYAVAICHDENENNKLDKNFLGIPKEKYGFSNNQKCPYFKECSFKFNQDTTINIKLRK
jgi:uncharacterized protein (DUF2141 family)